VQVITGDGSGELIAVEGDLQSGDKPAAAHFVLPVKLEILL